MTLEPSLWRTLPEELLHLVFARLPIAGLGQLQVLSKEWKRNIDCKDSEFNQVFDATTHLKMFALISWDKSDEAFGRLYDVQIDKWHVFENNTDYNPVLRASAADGGLFCNPWQWRNAKWHLQIVVVNPLTQRKMKLPPLLMRAGESDVQAKMVQLTMDRNTKEYKVHVVGYMKTGGNDRLFAQVYDSHIKEWSVVESREGRIIGWEHSGHSLVPMFPCVYNCADGNLQHFDYSDIAPGLMVVPDCIELINEHLFVLHKEAPPGSANLTQDGESLFSGKCCISEFHLPENATAWVKLGVHECDPSIYYSPEKDYELSLLACNGLLLVHSYEYRRKYDRVWLYNLSTCAWRSLTELEMPHFHYMLLCEISWTALP